MTEPSKQRGAAVRASRQQRAAEMVARRNATILEAAIQEAGEVGYQWITREAVATRAGVSAGSVNNAYGRMVELKRAVLREAVARGLANIVAQGLADNHEIARNAPPELKAKAVALMAQ